MSGKKQKILLAAGAVMLIILLIIWLTVAFLSGDTDVGTMPTPLGP